MRVERTSDEKNRIWGPRVQILSGPRAKPSPPAYLNPYAREEWDRLANTLHPIGALTAIDQNSFASYCMAYSRRRQAEEDLERMAQMDASMHGAVLKTKAGNFYSESVGGRGQHCSPRHVAMGCQPPIGKNDGRTRMFPSSGSLSGRVNEGAEICLNRCLSPGLELD